MWELGCNNEVGKTLKCFAIASGSKYLEVSESNERWCHPTDDGAGFRSGITVIIILGMTQYFWGNAMEAMLFSENQKNTKTIEKIQQFQDSD